MRERIQNINLSIRKISEKAAEQDDIVRFDIGQPSFDTPEHVKEAAREGLEEKQGYSPMLGIEELREAVAEEESVKKGLEVSSDEVMVTTGGMGALYAIMAARLGADDKAVFNDPCWGPYKMISEVSENQWSQVQYWNDERELREEAREEIADADLVIVNTPGNPTGYVLNEEQAREIAEVAEENDTFLVSDEVYHRLTYGREHYSPAAYAENAAIIGSASKNHAMTGWRIGWLVDSPENIEEYAKVSRASTACPPRISQYAAVEALQNDSHVDEMQEAYEERRDLLVERMNDLGWDFVAPEGAIYAFPEVGEDSWDFCMDMIEEGVAMVPGEPMGPDSDQNVRICFGSTTKEEIEKAFDRLENR
ncbi:pyridoxal phosphate-dependent aminotransferase [Candidatus Nanohalovita haloferacivicina]|uniref:pyridoxal phosphate-dependent aminotransferase n=1 Tax=Candidatus Nanohalovita haloferacivicina TaxID=2978046 RepID=UPI00325FCABE|nr:Aspartate aminotransferase [Candidatus Nanohalobia archaeon BNXNv]